MTPNVLYLNNGMKMIHYPLPESPVTHCGLMIKAGARDEPVSKTGIAHFIEHILFKGTRKRKAYHILNSLEIIGGELNAYTTKEETCIHASVMNRYTDRATELISDIIYNSTFPVKELEKEKKVIIDEIHAYEDMPYEQIFEDFEAILFNNHPLGNSILGKEQHIKSYSQKDVLKFIKGAYNEKNMVWVMAGPASESEVLKQANRFFTKIKFNGIINRINPITNRQKSVVLKKPNSQYHFIAGKRAYPFTHSNRFTLILLNNILGGPGMNSRLSMNIREKYGYTYTIESGYHALSDTGIFHIYFATEQQYFEKVKKLVFQEIEKMMNEKMSERRLNQYKQQLIGQITMSQENKLNVMLALAKNSLYFSKILSLEEIIEKINNISISQYEKVGLDILNSKNMSTLIYEPET